MKEVMDLLHGPMGGAIAFIILSSAARALPDPPADGSLFYRWLYNFSHTLLANFDKVTRKSQ